MSESGTVIQHGGFSKRGHECIIHVWDGHNNSSHGDVIADEKGNYIEVESDSPQKSITVQFTLPLSAFKLRLRGANSPLGHQLENIWQELIVAKSLDAECPLFIDAITKAQQAWDVETLELLTSWFKAVAEYDAVPLTNTHSDFDDISKLPLKNGVAKLLLVLEKFITQSGSIPSKERLRTVFDSYQAEPKSIDSLDFDKALLNTGLMWLENKTHLHDPKIG